MTPDAPSIDNCSNSFPGDRQTHRRLLYWESTSCLAELCDLPALTRAARMLGLRIELPRDPNGRRPDLRLARAGAAYHLSIGRIHHTIPEAGQLAQYLAMTLPWTFCNLSPYPMLHAAGCVVDDQAVIFCGGGETGKSSLTAAAWEAGLPIINDDRMAIDAARASVRPFPQCLSLRLAEPTVPEPLARLAGQGGQYLLGTGWKSDHWVVFSRSLPGFVPYGASLGVRALYLIRRGGTTHRAPADRQTALRSILAQAIPGRAGKLALLPFVEALVSQGKILELEVADGEVSRAVSLAVFPRM